MFFIGMRPDSLYRDPNSQLPFPPFLYGLQHKVFYSYQSYSKSFSIFYNLSFIIAFYCPDVLYRDVSRRSLAGLRWSRACQHPVGREVRFFCCLSGEIRFSTCHVKFAFLFYVISLDFMGQFNN